MKFKNFYNQKIDLNNMNRAMFEELRDICCNKKNKNGIDKFFLMTNDELENNNFYQMYPHLK